jgi:tripartite ATP-independent transporter DctM subunit
MDWWLTLIIIFGSLIIVMLSGLPVAFSFLLIDLVGVMLLWGGTGGLEQLILSMGGSISTFTLLPVGLFILMGEVFFQSGMGLRAIDVLDKWMGRMPGRLGLLAVASGTLFGTLSGMSMASVAMLGSVLVPEMEEHGYKKPMSLGPILGSGGLAIMIPPSSLAIILATLGQFSVAQLLIAIIVPGLLMATFYSLYIIVRCTLQPHLAPSYKTTPTPLNEKIGLTFKHVLPLALIVFLVTGVIYVGVATPTEAAATGAFGAMVLAFIYRDLNREKLKATIFNTVEITVFILMIITGSAAFSQILVFSGAIGGFTKWVVSLPVPPVLLLIAMQLVVLFLGCFMDQVAIMMITLPIFMPVINLLGINPVWFGVLYLLNLEIATISPPFGMSLFVMKGVAPADTKMMEIYTAALPFIGVDLVVMALMITFPGIVLWLV